MGAWPQSRTCQPSLGKGREEGRQRGEDRWQVAGVAIGGFHVGWSGPGKGGVAAVRRVLRAWPCEEVVLGGLALEPGGIWNAFGCGQWYAGGGALSEN